MKRITRFCTFGILLLSCHFGSAAEWRIGISRIEVTPAKSLWMSGYAARKRPANGTVHPLMAKALVIEDPRGERVVIVTTDLIGDEFGRELPDSVGARVFRRTGIKRERIILNASHTHCGPVVRVSDGARVTYGLDAQQQDDVNAYYQVLKDKLVQLVVKASERLRPATLSYGVGTTTFAMNRRTRYNPDGPVDHTVPVLRIGDENDQLLAVLFGYACHTATLGGDFYRYNGDYAGFAQIAFERARMGSTAMFLAGCGADVNPHPRGNLELAEQHGESLAGAVSQVLNGEMHPVAGPLSVAFDRIDLPFVDPPTQAALEERRGEGSIYDQRLTEVLLERCASKRGLESAYPCPVHVVKFGDDLVLIALGGEVVVDYALRFRREFSAQRIWVAGYCNEVFAYVPSERVLSEGGYEAEGAMRYFGWHGPFKPGVEDRVVDRVKELMNR